MERLSFAARAGRGPQRLGVALVAALLAALGLAVATAAPSGSPSTSSTATAPIAPAEAWRLADEAAQPPLASDPRWRRTPLPDTRPSTTWYRVEFDHPGAAGGDGTDAMWALYLPYFYGGGRIWLNGELAALVPESDAETHVRWERPVLLPLPANLFRAGRNELLLRAAPAHLPSGAGLPRLEVGPVAALQPTFDRRLLWVRTIPVVTVLAGSAVGLLFLFIWWRRPNERLYGLFGLAALLWALRTLTFVFDTIPVAWWSPWRALYHASTGGFIVTMALFALELAGWYRRRLALGLAAYCAIGPLVTLLLPGPATDAWVNRWWVAGTIPIGLSIVVVTAIVAWREQRAATTALAVALAIAVASGIHDYLIAWRSPLLSALAPGWADQRIFLLHHGANLLLLVMGVLVSTRFVTTLRSLEDMNRTLEARVAEREREIAANYAEIAALQREQAATDERQRIMQDLHDGLGSRLLTSLSRVERGAADAPSLASMLRDCIGEMRLAIEALAGDEPDLRTALGSFMFRWQRQLADMGIASSWQLADDGPPIDLGAHDTLQVLRVLQEALTNVVKHARASRVQVTLTRGDSGIALVVEDDGCGLPEATSGPGRGLANMQSRARRLGAQVAWARAERGSRVTLTLPARPHATAIG